MNRSLDNFLESYMQYTKNTESAKQFHKWVGISIISAVLRKKVKFALGRISIFPNLYVVLVAEPGKARKTAAINFGEPLLRNIDDIKLTADSITREALIQELEASAVDSLMPDGRMFKHSSLSIISPEFESFLGQKTENAKLLILLTDLFDCSEKPWEYRTKNSGSNKIPSVFLSILGATTPESLALTLPQQAIGGGFTSRVLFIWADKKDRKVAIPSLTPELKELQTKLKSDLYKIAQLSGQYEFTIDSKDYWINWYNEYEDLAIDRLCTDPAFNGWYSRKPIMIIKTAMAFAAAESNELLIHTKHFQQATEEIELVESEMAKAFRSVGKSAITAEMDIVLSIIRANKQISEKNLMRAVWRDLDSVKFVNVIDTIISTGRVKLITDNVGKKFYRYVTD